MKYVYLIIALFLFASCEVAEIEDFSVLTQDEKDAILDDVQEERDVSYLFNDLFDTVSIPEAVILQRVYFSDRSLRGIGQFSIQYRVANCDIESGRTSLMYYNIALTDSNRSLHLKKMVTAFSEPHIDGLYKVSLILDVDTIKSNVTGQQPCDSFTGGGFQLNINSLTDTLSLYGFSKDESEFISEQLNRIAPQI
jgi:hypothetical protein